MCGFVFWEEVVESLMMFEYVLDCFVLGVWVVVWG